MNEHDACTALDCQSPEAIQERCPKFDLYEWKLATDTTQKFGSGCAVAQVAQPRG